MPKLKNARHERFVQGLVQGKTAEAAYTEAGYKPNRFNASRLKTNEHVLRRLSELQVKAAEKAMVTVESLTEEYEQARLRALELGQTSAAVAASSGKMKLHGLGHENHRHAGHDGGSIKHEDVTERDADDFTRSIAGLAARSGADATSGSTQH